MVVIDIVSALGYYSLRAAIGARHHWIGRIPFMTTQVQIFCVKCKAKTDSSDVQGVTMKNGRPATQAICTVCGTKKFRIGAMPDA